MGAVGRAGSAVTGFGLDRQAALALRKVAAEAAIVAKLPWSTDPVVLTPSKQFVDCHAAYPTPALPKQTLELVGFHALRRLY